MLPTIAYVVLLCPVFVLSAHENVTCSGAADNGVLEIGCWGFKTCIDGVVEHHVCPSGMVLERDSMQCYEPGFANTECGQQTLCYNRRDGRYADIRDQCSTYFTCKDQIYYGRIYCPAFLAFNEEIQVCDYRRAIRQPCGDLMPRQ